MSARPLGSPERFKRAYRHPATFRISHLLLKYIQSQNLQWQQQKESQPSQKKRDKRPNVKDDNLKKKKIKRREWERSSAMKNVPSLRPPQP